ncbi:hypothetical protein [Micromonospora sp. NPDC051141]|uniref:hypothetical protein n=1 Tax=Micromonospora sp. NPDC051141 TaxID=3364284 RepID=UPI00379489E2
MAGERIGATPRQRRVPPRSGARLAAAERLLADGMPAPAVDAAARQLAMAATSAAGWGDAVQPELSWRAAWGLRMYACWADLA